MSARKFGANLPTEYFGIQISIGSGLREARIVPPRAGTPADRVECGNLTAADWEEVKRQALALLGSRVLDTPSGHLCYIRQRIASVTLEHV